MASQLSVEKSGKESPVHTSIMDNHSAEIIKNADGSELIVQEARITTKTKIVGAAITIGGFLFGYDIGVISGCLIMPAFYVRFGGVTSMPQESASLLTSLLSIGTLVGSLSQGPISDALGRRKAMITWAGVFGVGALIQTTFEHSLAQIVIGRVIAGLAVGALSGLCPLYLGETVPAYIRGTIVSCYQLMIIIGIVVSYGITWASSTRARDLSTSLSWRIPIGMQLLWAVVLFSIMLMVPESPRWLLMKDRREDARAVMARMRGVDLVTDSTGQLRGPSAMEAEFRDMYEGIEAERQVFAGTNWFTAWTKCFSTEQKMWYRTGMGMMLQTLQQLNGQNFFYYYGPTFFTAAAVSLDAYQIQFIFGVVSMICTVPALYLIERIGRRKSLLIGSFAQAACAFVVAFLGKYALAPDGTPPDLITPSQKSAGNAFIAFAVIFLALFSMFWGPVPWTFLSESS